MPGTLREVQEIQTLLKYQKINIGLTIVVHVGN